MSKLVLGTRGSPLALWQARHVSALLISRHPKLTVEQRIIKTEGDIHQDKPLGPGDRGLFVRGIERKLLSGEIDIAVHSLKDLPTSQPDGLVIAAVPERGETRDALLSSAGWSFEEVPDGTVIATGSYRRRTQLLFARPGLRMVPVRGNVDSRVRKLHEGRFGALVLALAGVQRLGIDSVPCSPIDPSICLPAVGQGALAIETRAEDEDVLRFIRELDHESSSSAVGAERAFLARLGGGCLAPATAFAGVESGALHIRAAVGDPDGSELMRDSERCPLDRARASGIKLAERMLQAGAGALLERSRSSLTRDGSL